MQLLSKRAAVFPRMKFVGQIPPSSGVPQQDTGMQASMAILALTLPLPLTQVFVHQSQRLPWNRKLWTSQGVVSKHVFSFTPIPGGRSQVVCIYIKIPGLKGTSFCSYNSSLNTRLWTPSVARIFFFSCIAGRVRDMVGQLRQHLLLGGLRSTCRSRGFAVFSSQVSKDLPMLLGGNLSSMITPQHTSCTEVGDFNSNFRTLTGNFQADWIQLPVERYLAALPTLKQ